MTEDSDRDPGDGIENEDLRSQLDDLKREVEEARQLADSRVMRSELKLEAYRAGMIDLDGLAFLDLSNTHLAEDGTLSGGRELIDHLARSKPWLFRDTSSSSTAKAPSSRPARQKLATEMSDDEYRIARRKILNRSV